MASGAAGFVPIDRGRIRLRVPDVSTVWEIVG
jgi:hypothetical protein